METIQIDWPVVFLAAIINMLIGFVWYSKWLFGSTGRKAALKTDHSTKKEISRSIYGFIVSLVIAFFLAFFEAFLGVTNVTDGMFVGFCFWLGFVATTQIAPVIWEDRPLSSFFLHTGYKLLSYLVMGGLLGA